MRIIFGLLLVLAFANANAQTKLTPYGVLPAERQLKWHEMEMYVLVHFTPTTFENKEWGYGDADPRIFNPTQFDANQIVNAVKAGGFKGLILVAKHHDGFALWPTKTTDYNISKSPFRNGKGDMVKEFEQACRKAGLDFGVYCSPWDRNSAVYGTHDYVKKYREQLRELYSNYGKLFMSWHDGANGGDGYYGGAREARKIDRTTYYGWDTTWAMTRKMQPMASIFSDIGPDARWVGNEEGFAAETSWATFTPVPEDGATKVGPGSIKHHNLGTGDRNGVQWTAAECDVPLRLGWFYHKDQDSKVKTPEKLFELYLKSVGRGGCLDLGVAPDTRGLLHENDVASLKEFGDLLNKTFANDFAKQAAGVAKALTDNDRYTYATGSEFVMEWKEAKEFDLLRVRENIKLGQRVDEFVAEAWVDGAWKEIAKATSVGSARILQFPAVKTSKLRVRITKSAVPPAVSEIGVFKKSQN
jgi:alpha-L-fucosidase